MLLSSLSESKQKVTYLKENILLASGKEIVVRSLVKCELFCCSVTRAEIHQALQSKYLCLKRVLNWKVTDMKIG